MIKKVKWGPTDQQTDQPTDGRTKRGVDCRVACKNHCSFFLSNSDTGSGASETAPTETAAAAAEESPAEPSTENEVSLNI